MRLRVLGCSGGIGGTAQTTAFLLNDRVLIDAGTGLTGLSLEEMCLIDDIFLSHAHFDHLACLPMLLDSVVSLRQSPIRVHALPETIEALRLHIFNWHIWPDFTQIPDPGQPCLAFCALQEADVREIGDLTITALSAHHTVPAVGFLIEDAQSALAYSGDTLGTAAFWARLNITPQLRALIIETAFPERELDLARRSRHLCPSLLARELQSLERPAEILITHLKPADADLIMQELHAAGLAVRELQQGEQLVF